MIKRPKVKVYPGVDLVKAACEPAWPTWKLDVKDDLNNEIAIAYCRGMSVGALCRHFAEQWGHVYGYDFAGTWHQQEMTRPMVERLLENHPLTSGPPAHRTQIWSLEAQYYEMLSEREALSSFEEFLVTRRAA